MEDELKQNLKETLNKFNRIDFKVFHHHKGHEIDIRIGNLKNDECGIINSQLESWLGYEEFSEFLISHDIFYDFKGWIVNENDDIVIYVIFWGPYDDEFESIFFQFEDDFVKNKLLINSNLIKKNDFDVSNLYFNFSFENSAEIEFGELYYLDDKIILDDNQLKLIKLYLQDELTKITPPKLNIDFDCIQNWSLECYENNLNYKIFTNPIKFYWDEI